MIRILIVDGDASARRQLVELFSATKDFIVVASVASGEEAIRAVKRLQPDLISLDAVLPGLTPAEVVRRVLSTHPVPVVLVSDLPRDATEVFDALAAGALDFIRKPPASDASSSIPMLEMMRALAQVKVSPRLNRSRLAQQAPVEIIVVAASTGGPAPLQILLSMLPADLAAPMVIAQHLAAGFEETLATWLARSSPMEVRLAKDRDVLTPGIALIGRPDCDVVIVSRLELELRPKERGGFHPSADELFASAASTFGPGSLAVVLSGIGQQGAEGARAIVAAGGRVFSQDRQSSVVFGMPAEVARQGLASVIAPPEGLARAICDAMRHTVGTQKGAPHA